MRIFVTGAGGFIGRHVVGELLNRGHHVVANRRERQDGDRVHPNLSWVYAELSHIAADAYMQCDVFLHLAAAGVIAGNDDWEASYKVNVHDSLSAWRAAKRCGVKKFIICGSCFEYGRTGERVEFLTPDCPLMPVDAYGASKAAASLAAIAFCSQNHLGLTILRLFQVYGDGENAKRFWPNLCAAAKEGRDLHMSLGQQIRDFIPVNVAAQRIVAEAESLLVAGPVCNIKHVATGVPTTLAEFAKRWWSTFNARGRLVLGSLPYRRNEVMRYVSATWS